MNMTNHAEARMFMGDILYCTDCMVRIDLDKILGMRSTRTKFNQNFRIAHSWTVPHAAPALAAPGPASHRTSPRSAEAGIKPGMLEKGIGDEVQTGPNYSSGL